MELSSDNLSEEGEKMRTIASASVGFLAVSILIAFMFGCPGAVQARGHEHHRNILPLVLHHVAHQVENHDRARFHHDHLDFIGRRFDRFGLYYRYRARAGYLYPDYDDCYYDGWFWWLLRLSQDERDLWYYNHWRDMDAARIRRLEEEDENLSRRMSVLEERYHGRRDSNYVPPGIEPDLQYKDEYLEGVR